MRQLRKFIFLALFLASVKCTPWDDGKYRHKTYDGYDDGKYYRPLDEGKYIRGDEGKYTYIYTKGVWPYDGTYKHLEVGDKEYEIYAPRFPYAWSVIAALTNQFESPDILTLGEFSQRNPDYYGNLQAQNLNTRIPNYEEKKSKENAEAVNQYFPPLLKLKDGEKLGTVYNYKGTKVLSTQADAKTKKLKLEYEVFVRIVDDENN